MRHHQIAAREDQALRHVALHMDVGRLRAQVGRVALAADRHDERPGLRSSPLEDGREQPRHGAIHHRAEGGIDDGRLQGAGRPIECGVDGRPVEDGRAEGVMGRREGRDLERGRAHGEVEVAMDHRQLGVGRQAQRLSVTGERRGQDRPEGRPCGERLDDGMRDA